MLFITQPRFNLETAVGDGKLTQSFEPQSFLIGGAFTIRECRPRSANDSDSKSCITLPSRTAVSRFKAFLRLSTLDFLHNSIFPSKAIYARSLLVFALLVQFALPAETINQAEAVLKPTKGNQVKGIVTFTQMLGGVKVVADIEGLTPGKHGFHIHEFGDCSAPDASSAGAHFNPTKVAHGGPDSDLHHAGDLGNIIADEDGDAYYEDVWGFLNLNGPDSIIGKSVIVHQKEDDLKSQPAGDAGSRQACGVIKAKGTGQ